MNLLRIPYFVLFVTMGMLFFNTASAQTKPKPKKKEKLEDDGIPKKVKPDPDIDKYFKGGRAPIKSNAIVLNISDPLFGYISAGFQRKLHRHFLAEVGAGPGIISGILANSALATELAIDNAATQANAGNSGSFTYFSSANFKTFKPKFQTYGIITYAFTGPLVNYSYGVGTYIRYRYADVKYNFPNATGTIGSLGYGLLLQSQSMLKGPVGWGFNVGGGFERSSLKDVPTMNNDTPAVTKTFDIKMPAFGFFASLRLTYVL